MAFVKNKKSNTEDKDGGGESKYIGTSGIFDVTILAPFVSEGPNGSISVDLAVDYNGQSQAIYGNMRVYNNDGSDNEIGQNVLQHLCIIADVEYNDLEDPIEADLPIGKKGADKEVAVLEQLADISCKMQVQMEYGAYKGDIKEKTVIREFWREDGASAAEIINDGEIGKALAVTEEKYASNVTYKDDVTPEQVAEWIAAKRPKGTAGKGAAASTGATSAKPKPKFGKK